MKTVVNIGTTGVRTTTMKTVMRIWTTRVRTTTVKTVVKIWMRTMTMKTYADCGDNK